MSLPGSIHPDCPHWKERENCLHDPGRLAKCSLPSHVPYHLCALNPDERRPTGQEYSGISDTSQGCVKVLLNAIGVVFLGIWGLLGVVFVAIGLWRVDSGSWMGFWVILGLVFVLIQGVAVILFLRSSKSAKIWEAAIAAAENGHEQVAVDAFLKAIVSNPNYYISAIKPATPRAESCWKRAVDAYIKHKDPQICPGGAGENHCAICGRDLGNQWHYYFESLLLGNTIGATCADCNRKVCKEHLEPAAAGHNRWRPCAECGGEVIELQEGPAYSSLVETARSAQRYRGGIRDPASSGRVVVLEE